MTTLRPILLSLVITLLTLANPIVAHAGPGSLGGGGDPEAYLFVARLTQAAKIFQQSGHGNIADPALLISAASEIMASLDSKDTSLHLIEFVPDPIIVGGVHKPAMYDAGARRIKIHRSSWLEYERTGRHDRQRAIAVLEALLLKGIIDQRYTRAGQLIYIGDERVNAVSALVLERKMVVSFLDCDDSYTLVLTNGKRFPTKMSRSSLNVNWRSRGREFILNGYFNALDGSRMEVLASQASSSMDTSSGKNIQVSKARAITLNEEGRLDETKDQWSSDVDLPQNVSKSQSGHETVRLQYTYRRPDGGLIVETRTKDNTGKDGVRTENKISTCSYRFLNEDWMQEANDTSWVVRVKKFARQIDRVTAAEVAYDRCRLQEEDCTTSLEHLNQVDSDTMKTWDGLFRMSDFTAQSNAVQKAKGIAPSSTPIKKHRSRDKHRWQDADKREEWRTGSGLTREDIDALDRGMARSRIQDCGNAIRRGGACDFSGLTEAVDVLFPSRGLK